jgi:hypothetical protein
MQDHVRYADIRPYVVPETLTELIGPTAGVVRLPGHLDWSEQRVYNLDDPAELGLLYETVIRESASADDLRTFLNEDMLRRVWPRLWLPARVRRLWQASFPQLVTVA